MYPSFPSLTDRHKGLWSIVLLTAATGFAPAEQRSPVRLPDVRGCYAPPPPRPAGAPAPIADFVMGVSLSLRWLVNGAVNPTLTLTRGRTYTFDLTTITDEHPMVINATASHPFPPLVFGPAHDQVVPFTPDMTMPSTLYYHCEVHYGLMTGTIHLVQPPCAGDQNGDDLVNVSDFGIFANAFGTPCPDCPSDLNDDGLVNVVDFGLFANRFGAVCL